MPEFPRPPRPPSGPPPTTLQSRDAAITSAAKDFGDLCRALTKLAYIIIEQEESDDEQDVAVRRRHRPSAGGSGVGINT